MAQVLISEYSRPANARHGHYVQVRGTREELRSGALRQAADLSAALAGYDPEGATEQGMPVSEDRGTVRVSVWYFRSAFSITCPGCRGKFYSADFKVHYPAAHGA